MSWINGGMQSFLRRWGFDLEGAKADVRHGWARLAGEPDED